MNITLRGRPGAIKRFDDLVVTTMQRSLNHAQLPDGFPAPTDDTVTFLVFIAHKQWRQAERPLKHERTQLILHGILVYDAAHAIYAVHVHALEVLAPKGVGKKRPNKRPDSRPKPQDAPR